VNTHSDIQIPRGETIISIWAELVEKKQKRMI
jgi:hypothetical protein